MPNGSKGPRRRRWPPLAAAGLVAGSVLVLGAVPAGRRALEDVEAPPPAIRPGVILVASPGLRGSRFAHTVVVVIAVAPPWTAGLVLDGPRPPRLPRPPRWGGPVWRGVRHALVSAATPLAAGVVLPGGLMVSRHGAGVPGARRFLGLAGWAPGGLAREVDEGMWAVLPGTRARIHPADPGALWPELAAVAMRRFPLR